MSRGLLPTPGVTPGYRTSGPPGVNVAKCTGPGFEQDGEWSIASSRSSTPTLVLAGSGNLDHPSFATEALAVTPPDVRVAVLDGHGHRANRSDPGLVADEVGPFLADTAP